MDYARMGLLFLSLMLITEGAMALSGTSLPHAATVLEVMAILTGILILIGTWRTGAYRWWWR